MLNKISKSQKTNNILLHLHEISKVVKFTESRMVIAWGSLRGKGKSYLIAVEFQFGKLEMFCQ